MKSSHSKSDSHFSMLNGKRVLFESRDLSLRTELSKQLQESEEIFKSFVANTINGIGLCDEEGIFTVWNSGMVRITGLEKEKVLGNYIWDIQYQFFNHSKRKSQLHEKLKKTTQKILEKGKIPKKLLKREIQLVNTKAKAKTIQSLSFLIPTGKGYKIGIIFRDITTEKALEYKIKQKSKEVQEIDKLKSKFLNNISHELKTPLTCLTTYSELLKDALKDKVDEKQRLCLKEIEHNVKRLVIEVESLLDLSNLESDRMFLNREMMNVKEQIYIVVRDMRPIFKQKRVELVINVERIPKLCLDQRAFRQIITNLLNNAIKNTLSGEIVIINAEYANGELFCSVTDQGSGIDPHNLSDVFEKYYYAPQKDALAIGGTGLGLALCKKLVTMHGGRIWVRNNPERGSTFYFTI